MTVGSLLNRQFQRKVELFITTYSTMFSTMLYFVNYEETLTLLMSFSVELLCGLHSKTEL